jgi:hypothetical protein
MFNKKAVKLYRVIVRCPYPHPLAFSASRSRTLRYGASILELCDEKQYDKRTIEDLIGLNSPGTTSSIERGARLNGSFESDNKWDLIVALSRTVFDEGRSTGSRITVNIKGSFRASKSVN